MLPCLPMIISLMYIFIQVLTPSRSSSTPSRSVSRSIPSRTCRPSPPFSVGIQDAVISNSSMVLSCVRIPKHWCPPHVQRSHSKTVFSRKTHHLRVRHNRRQFCKRLFLSFLTFYSFCPVAYSIEGSGHAIIHGEASSDVHRQQDYVTTVIQNVQHSNDPSTSLPVASNASSSKPSYLKDEPIVFIADTDSVLFCIDTGANRVIVNDAKSIDNFKPSAGSVKGINGSPTALKGTGSTTLSLTDNDNISVKLPDIDVVYVPSSPYNLLPPQLLIKYLKAANYKADYFRHDDKSYTITFTPPNASKPHTVTVPINKNELFLIRTSPGYTKFHHHSNSHKSWCAFAGPVCTSIDPTREDHSTPRPGTLNGIGPNVVTPPPSPTHVPANVPTNVIAPSPSSSSKNISKTREQRHGKTREQQNNQTKAKPVNVSFGLDAEATQILNQAKEIAYQRKQFRLMTIHEQLGHLSFSILKLMARCGMIPRELANVEPLPCPGCAYGKVHRRQWRYKGIRNMKKLRMATSPGEVVSMDQMVSPMPGFVPVHRGNPTTQRYCGATILWIIIQTLRMYTS